MGVPSPGDLRREPVLVTRNEAAAPSWCSGELWLHCTVKMIVVLLSLGWTAVCGRQLWLAPCAQAVNEQQDGLKESKLQQEDRKKQPSFLTFSGGRLVVRPTHADLFSKLWQPELTCVDSLEGTMSKQHLPVQLADSLLSKQESVAAARQVLQTPDNKPHASAKEDTCGDKSNKELSQGENIHICNVGVNPLIPELFQDTHTHPQEGASSMGTRVAEEAAGNLRSVSPAPAGHTNAKPAASALAKAPAQELLTPAKQRMAKGPASRASKRPSRFRRALQTLRRAFCIGSRATQESEQQCPADSTRRVS